MNRPTVRVSAIDRPDPAEMARAELAKMRADKDLLLRRVGVLAAELDRLIGADARIALMWREGVLP